MSSKKTTTQTTQFDPNSMNQYQSFWSMASPLLNSLIQNPYNNSNYALNLAQNQQVAGQTSQQAIKNSLSNLNTTGMGQTNSGVRAALLAQGARFGSAMNYQAFTGAANQAQSNQWNAMGVQAGRSPLVTGQTQVQQTSGLGSWLPQVAGAALGAAGSIFSGGLTSAARAAGGAANSLFQGSSQGGLFSNPFANGGMGGSSYFNPANITGPSANAAAPSMLTSNPFALR